MAANRGKTELTYAVEELSAKLAQTLLKVQELSNISLQSERQLGAELASLTAAQEAELRNETHFPGAFQFTEEQIEKLQGLAAERWDLLVTAIPKLEEEMFKHMRYRERLARRRQFQTDHEQSVRATVEHIYIYIYIYGFTDGLTKLFKHDHQILLNHGLDEPAIKNFCKSVEQLLPVLHEHLQSLEYQEFQKRPGRRKDYRMTIFAMRIAEICEQCGITPSIARFSLHFELVKELFSIMGERKEDPDSLIRSAKRERAKLARMGIDVWTVSS